MRTHVSVNSPSNSAPQHLADIGPRLLAVLGGGDDHRRFVQRTDEDVASARAASTASSPAFIASTSNRSVMPRL